MKVVKLVSIMLLTALNVKMWLELSIITMIMDLVWRIVPIIIMEMIASIFAHIVILHALNASDLPTSSVPSATVRTS